MPSFPFCLCFWFHDSMMDDRYATIRLMRICLDDEAGQCSRWDREMDLGGIPLYLASLQMLGRLRPALLHAMDLDSTFESFQPCIAGLNTLYSQDDPHLCMINTRSTLLHTESMTPATSPFVSRFDCS